MHCYFLRGLLAGLCRKCKLLLLLLMMMMMIAVSEHRYAMGCVYPLPGS
jgi:hypothetical protein